MNGLFEYVTKSGAIVTTMFGSIIISSTVESLDPDEAEDLAIGLMRAAQWQRIQDAESRRATAKECVGGAG